MKGNDVVAFNDIVQTVQTHSKESWDVRTDEFNDYCNLACLISSCWRIFNTPLQECNCCNSFCCFLFLFLFFIDGSVPTYSLLGFWHPLTFMRKRYCWYDVWWRMVKVFVNKIFIIKHDFTLGSLVAYESLIAALLVLLFATFSWSY